MVRSWSEAWFKPIEQVSHSALGVALRQWLSRHFCELSGDKYYV